MVGLNGLLSRPNSEASDASCGLRPRALTLIRSSLATFRPIRSSSVRVNGAGENRTPVLHEIRLTSTSVGSWAVCQPYNGGNLAPVTLHHLGTQSLGLFLTGRTFPVLPRQLPGVTGGSCLRGLGNGGGVHLEKRERTEEAVGLRI